MFLSQLFEAIDKRHAAFCFGRMNPPTIGHGQLINTVAKSAAGGDYFIFTSQSHDAKKNPLDYATKIKFIKALFPEHAGHVVQDTSLKTIIQVAHWLYAKGYRNVTFVAGSDRIEGFTELLNKYNGVEGPNGFYKFDTINFASSGDRDPDGDGLAGISATAAREAAKANNLEAFSQATGAGELAPQLFQAVRKGMLVEEVNEAISPGADNLASAKKLYQYTVKYIVDLASNASFDLKHDNYPYIEEKLSNLFKTPNGQPIKVGFIESGKIQMWNGVLLIPTLFMYRFRGLTDRSKFVNDVMKALGTVGVQENASGYIPKNKKEAQDPRWSNALTVDVHPDTPRKNMKSLRLI